MLQRKSKTTDEKRVDVLEEDTHKAVFEADPYSRLTNHRRIAWVLRLMTAYSIVVTALATVAIYAITTLLPLKTTEIALLRADPKDSRIYRVEPISVEVDGFQLFLEQMSRRYTANILAIDGLTQNKRFEEVRVFSDVDHFNSFLNDNEQRIKEALKDGLNRSITVHSASHVDSYDGVHQYAVDFTQTDKLADEEPEARELVAYLEMTTRPSEVTEAERYENPLGIRILDMVVKEKTND
ncbi:VirB8/TrbF family protein [Polycladidibacter hongkongensis]|uniref:VirB8/TrbF family protein n=1 Tax=Polycladidibacter hongkongensis TaxID=1647556 RepID=UPI000830586F|nr:VirB8/TrbF family protein [Pseudovibrio hongkongensis]